MDVPPANQSQTTCQPWTIQNSWSIASTQGLPCHPLPSSQHLRPGLTCDQSSPCVQLQSSNQGCQNIFSTSQSTNKTHHKTLYKAFDVSSTSSPTMLDDNSVHQRVSHVVSDAHQSPHISSMVRAVSHGKNIPPSSLLLTNQGIHPCRSQEIPLCSPHSPNQGESSLYSHQGLQNGLQSPYQRDFFIHPPSCGQYVNQGPQTTPHFEGPNGVNSHCSPTFPIHQQPQWTPPPDTRGWLYL